MFLSPSVYPKLGSSLFSPPLDSSNGEILSQFSLTSPITSAANMSQSAANGTPSSSFLLSPQTLPENANASSGSIFSPQTAALCGFPLLNESSNATGNSKANSLSLPPSYLSTHNVNNTNPPLVSLVQRGLLSHGDILSLEGTTFTCTVQSNGQVTVQEDQTVHGLEEWIRSSQHKYNTINPDAQRVFDWSTVKVNGDKYLSSIRDAYYSAVSSGSSNENNNNLYNNTNSSNTSSNVFSPQLKAEYDKQKAEFYFTPFDDDCWKARNSIIYKDFNMQTFYNAKKDALYYSYDTIKSFLPPIARNDLDANQFFCEKHMFKCADIPFFQHFGFSFKEVICSDGVEHLYKNLRKNSNDDIRRSSIFLEEPVTLFKTIEERRNFDILIPKGNVIRSITLSSLISGSEQQRVQSHSREQLKESGARVYRCECGETFPTSQSKAGHSHFCKVHQEMKKKKNWKVGGGKGKINEMFHSDETITYKCDCGKTFPTSQAKAGHCHFCPVHQELKNSGKPTITNKQATSSDLLLSFGDFAVSSSTISSVVQLPLKANSSTVSSSSKKQKDTANPQLLSPSVVSYSSPSSIAGNKRSRDEVLSPLSKASLGDFSSSFVLSPKTLALYTAAFEEMSDERFEAPPPLDLSDSKVSRTDDFLKGTE